MRWNPLTNNWLHVAPPGITGTWRRGEFEQQGEALPADDARSRYECLVLL